jgi:hypothetical protein
MTQSKVVLLEKLRVENLSLLRHDAVSIGNHLRFGRGLILSIDRNYRRIETAFTTLWKTLIIKPTVVQIHKIFSVLWDNIQGLYLMFKIAHLWALFWIGRNPSAASELVYLREIWGSPSGVNKCQVFWDMIPCRLVKGQGHIFIYQRSRLTKRRTK